MFAVLADPFAQQIVKYGKCVYVLPSGTASIARSNNFTERGLGVEPFNQGLRIPTQGAFYSGLYNPQGPTAGIPFVCPSGNCTFPQPYWSVSIESTCSNITETLQLNMQTPVNRTITSTTSRATLLTSDHMVMVSETAMSDGLNWVNGAAEATPPLCVADMIMFSTSIHNGRLFGMGSSTGVLGARCTLQPVVSQFNSTIRNGTLNERRTATSPIPIRWVKKPDGPGQYALHVPCLSDAQQVYWRERGYRIDTTGDQWISFNSSDCLAQPDKIDAHCLYEFSQAQFSGLVDIFERFFSGSLSSGAQEGTNTNLEILYNHSGNSIDSLAKNFEDVAKALSATIRSAREPYSYGDPALGTAEVWETCVLIQWAYFSVPVALGMFSIVFFIWMLTHSSHGEVPAPWKSTPTSLLYHGFTPSSRGKLGAGATLSEMEAESEKTHVQLRFLGGNTSWKLIKTA